MVLKGVPFSKYADGLNVYTPGFVSGWASEPTLVADRAESVASSSLAGLHGDTGVALEGSSMYLGGKLGASVVSC